MTEMMFQFKNEIEATNKEMMSAMKEQLKENSKREKKIIDVISSLVVYH